MMTGEWTLADMRSSFTFVKSRCGGVASKRMRPVFRA